MTNVTQRQQLVIEAREKILLNNDVVVNNLCSPISIFYGFMCGFIHSYFADNPSDSVFGFFVSHFGFCLECGLYMAIKPFALNFHAFFLPQTHRFEDISVSNFIMQYLSIEFPPRSPQAGDNRGFYCTIMESPRVGVRYMTFIPRWPKYTLRFSIRRTVF